ncbi:MAG TPA: hypothetical protein VGE35_00410 [Candidatus Paceibacterota bacterium]
MKLTRLFFVVAVILTASVSSAQVETEVLQLRAFQVFAAIGDLVPIVGDANDPDSPVKKIWVKGISKESPAYKAGVRKGMFITHIESVAVEGLTIAQLTQATERLKVYGDHFKVIATKNFSSSTELVFPVPIPRARQITTPSFASN